MSGYEEVRSWLLLKAGKVVSHLHIASFVGGTNLISANMRMAVSGFRRTGIWPLDGNVFLEVDILTAATTDIALKRFNLTPCEETTSSAVWQRMGVSWFSNVGPSKSSFSRQSLKDISQIRKVGQEKKSYVKEVNRESFIPRLTKLKWVKAKKGRKILHFSKDVANKREREAKKKYEILQIFKNCYWGGFNVMTHSAFTVKTSA
jgi:hypothetical protein